MLFIKQKHYEVGSKLTKLPPYGLKRQNPRELFTRYKNLTTREQNIFRMTMDEFGSYKNAYTQPN